MIPLFDQYRHVLMFTYQTIGVSHNNNPAPQYPARGTCGRFSYRRDQQIAIEGPNLHHVRYTCSTDCHPIEVLRSSITTFTHLCSRPGMPFITHLRSILRRVIYFLADEETWVKALFGVMSACTLSRVLPGMDVTD
jgi:hypothetical protein